MRRPALLLPALVLGCAPAVDRPVVTVSRPGPAPVVGATSFELDAVVTGPGCASGASIAVSAGGMSYTLVPGTPLVLRVADLVTEPYADPASSKTVSIGLVPTCPRPEEGTHEGERVDHVVTLVAATAVPGDRPFDPATVAAHWYDTAGLRVLRKDGQGLLLLDDDGTVALGVDVDDVAFPEGAAATRRIVPAGPAVAGQLPFAAETIDTDPAARRTVIGAVGDAGESFRVVMDPETHSAGTASAYLANAATKTVYAMLPTRRIIAANASGVRWDAAPPLGSFTPENVRLGTAAGAAVRAVALANGVITVQDFRADGQPEGLPDDVVANGTVARWDLANARFVWFVDGDGFHLYEPYEDECEVPFPAGRRLHAPGQVPRIHVTTSPGGASVLALVATENVEGDPSPAMWAIRVDAACEPATTTLPLAPFETANPALYLANDARALVGGSSGAWLFAAGPAELARTLPAHLASFAYACGDGLCLFGGDGQPVSIPFAP